MVSMQLATLIFAVTGAGETILYDFQADSCGPCKMMAPVVERLAAEGYPVRKVDVDREKGLAQRFQVTSIPCFVLVVNGQERGRLVGATSYASLAGLLRQGGVQPLGTGVARAQSPDGAQRSPRSLFGSRSAPAAKVPYPPRVALGQPAANPYAPPVTQPAAPPIAKSAPAPVDEFVPQPQRRPLEMRLPPLPPDSFAQAREPSPPPVPPHRAARSLSDQLLSCSVRLKIQDPNGFSFGSGTIIDFRPGRSGQGGEALVLTCGHIFRDSHGDGAIQVDLFDLGQPQTVTGRMVRFDLQRDIGLVAIKTDRAVPVAALAPKGAKPTRGSGVISIGCDHGNDPTVQHSTITAINSFVGPPNLQVSGQPAVGRSGGGLFDQRGELIGVCNFADPTDRAGLYAAVQLAYDLLAQSGRPGDALASATLPSGSPPRGRPADPLVELAAATSRSHPTTELICVLRSQDGHPEVIVIDNASRELLARIAEERKRRHGAFTTSMEVPVREPVPQSQPAARGVLRTTTDWQPKWR